MSDRPEIVKYLFEERFLQKWHARRSAGAVLRADRALDQFDVAIAPLLQSFVEIGHQFEKDRKLGSAFVEPQNFFLHLFVRAVWLCDVTVLKIVRKLSGAP